MTQEMQIALGSTMEKLIESMRSSIEQTTTLSELLRQVATHMQQALRDPTLVPTDRWTYRDPE